MISDVANFCKSCDVYNRAKNPPRCTNAPLAPLKPVPLEFGDRLDIDMLSMPQSAEGHVAIITVVDAPTGFVFAKPCFNKSSNNVTSLILDNVIPYFGCPKIMVTWCRK